MVFLNCILICHCNLVHFQLLFLNEVFVIVIVIIIIIIIIIIAMVFIVVVIVIVIVVVIIIIIDIIIIINNHPLKTYRFSGTSKIETGWICKVWSNRSWTVNLEVLLKFNALILLSYCSQVSTEPQSGNSSEESLLLLDLPWNTVVWMVH